MSPSPFHPVTQFNSGQPLRDRRPDTLVHPFLSDVKFTLRAHAVCGIVDPISGASEQGTINRDKETLQLNTLIESDTAASPAAGNASDDCICLEFIGDNGYCPKHGDGHK
jgi:hypothetical protein